MIRKYWIFIFVCSVFVFGTETNRFIILGQDSDEKHIIQQKWQYSNMLKANHFIASLHPQNPFEVKIEKYHNHYLLKVGPFVDTNILAMVYLYTREMFPLAFMLDELAPPSKLKPRVKIVEKTIYKEKEVIVEKEDDELWIALFGMAVIGILFMFLSSDQIKRLKEEHTKTKIKHQVIEDKQHHVLANMGENIHSIAKETMTHTTELAEKVKSTALEEDFDRVVDNENELLDMTGDLIKFLRLKSKKVIIENEIFNLNHVLNEVAGVLNNTYKQNDTELIFDINKDVPKYLYSDSVHLGQILTNLLEYIIQHSQNKEIKLEIFSFSGIKEGLELKFHIDTEIKIEDKEHFFESYYDEALGNYIGLGLFVAKELSKLMGGEVEIESLDTGYDRIVISIPMKEKHSEKRKYRLPHKNLVGKKILIVDTSAISALAIEKLFAYFKSEIEVLSPEEFAKEQRDLAVYDIIALNNSLFKDALLEHIQAVKTKQNLKVISLENLFSSDESIYSQSIDLSLKKPLTQEYVFDTLIELYTVHSLKDNGIRTLATYLNPFSDTENVTLESFKVFRGAHILIVEDNIINQKVVLNMLGKSEMKLSIANHGGEALEFLRHGTEKVDFIFMDINMPIMDGFRATELIRSDSRFDDIAIVSLTALVSEHEIEKMFDSGMNGYLSKPVRIERLYSALHPFLDKGISKENTIGFSNNDTPIALDGLDIKDGLKHMKNNIIFYKEVLREFSDAYAQSDEVFASLVQEQRFGQVKLLCLDMKGLTGTIGAKEMHTLINEIYQYLIYKKPELLHSYVDRYKAELAKLNRSIDIYLSI